MSRHAHALERLCTKLHSRYGELDPLVLQVRAELETCKSKEASLVKAQEGEADQQPLFKVRQAPSTRRNSS